jgi:Polysaccharide lyase family 4, domain II
MRVLRQGLFVILVLSTCGIVAAQQYEVINVNNGGTISGTVKWVGPTPRIPSVTITKDAPICDPQAHKVRDLERLVIGPQGGIANTVVFLQDISRGKSLQLPAQRRFLDQKSCRYEPHILLVPAGEELQMKSSDATLHTVHMEGAATYNLPFPFPNQVVSREMHTPGLVSLKCNGGHTWMNAEMFVVSHPYYAVTDGSGRFELADVPPGEYTLAAWHEGWTVAREEGAFDVLTERRVQRPIFTAPKTWQKTVKVTANAEAVVNFTISEK